MCVFSTKVHARCPSVSMGLESDVSTGPLKVRFGLKSVPALMVQWLCHRLMGWYVLGSHLGTGSNTERGFKDPMGRCMALHPLLSH